jgi:hypothetical protein
MRHSLFLGSSGYAQDLSGTHILAECHLRNDTGNSPEKQGGKAEA